ncbi:MAG: glycosyltransferase family 2 protein, partial [Dehalococcoidia bacterium]|nr:glycosyltransferase family 2 protein [Dehalococcoidia bacterium]
CLLVRRRAIEEVGPLDEAFFMYSEELDWCRRMKQAGWKVVYLPEARVIHHYAKSSSQDLPHQHIWFQDSKCRYFAKHHGRLASATLRTFLWLTYLFRLGQEATKYLLGHKRALRRQRLGLLWRVLRSGLRA